MLKAAPELVAQHELALVTAMRSRACLALGDAAVEGRGPSLPTE